MDNILALILATLLFGTASIVIFGWLIKYNDNWFLKLSNIVTGIFFTFVQIVISLTQRGDFFEGLIPNVLMYVLVIFEIGFIISIFTGIINGVEQGSIVASIIVILVGIAGCCTGVGITIGIKLIRKGLEGPTKRIKNNKK